MEKNCEIVFSYGHTKVNWIPYGYMHKFQLHSNLILAMRLAQDSINRKQNKVSAKSLLGKIKTFCLHEIYNKLKQYHHQQQQQQHHQQKQHQQHQQQQQKQQQRQQQHQNQQQQQPQRHQQQQRQQIKISDDDLAKSKITIYNDEGKTFVLFELNAINETANYRWFKKTIHFFCLECRIKNGCIFQI